MRKNAWMIQIQGIKFHCQLSRTDGVHDTAAVNPQSTGCVENKNKGRKSHCFLDMITPNGSKEDLEK
jgi:hypothetical protein